MARPRRAVFRLVTRMVVPCAAALASGAAWAAEGLRLTVVPPAAVTERGRVEARVAVPDPGGTAGEQRVDFYWDRADAGNLISSEVVTAGPNGLGFARAWCPAAGRAGGRTLVCRVTAADGGVREASWPVTVTAGATRAPPRIQGVWLDPLALSGSVYPRERPATEADLRAAIDAYHRLGVRLLVVTYVEYQGAFFYPSALRFHDRDLGREAGGQAFDFDVVGTVLDQAERHGMHVMLGLGRGGDTRLLWEFDKPDWADRNAAALDVGRKVARELWDRYGHRRSFYGWYLTHEMNDLARAAAYYDPLADFCHALSPDKAVMAAPAGTPVVTREALAASRVDVFAYQDAVGAGYVPYRYTYQPENRLAELAAAYGQYRALHEGSGKHLWADLELWEMDGSAGYAGAYAAGFDRVRRQIDLAAEAVEMITAYEGLGFLEDPKAGSPLKDRRARRLFAEYEAYLTRDATPQPTDAGADAQPATGAGRRD
jgi:hypothetical protein